jgi:PiT family inorganic phosphate transporter
VEFHYYLVPRAALLVFAGIDRRASGAGIASSSTVHWSTGVVGKVIIPMILSPTVGLLGGYLLMVIALWVFRRANPHRVDRGFRIAQIFSATAWRSAMACSTLKRAWASSCSLW